MELHHNSGRGFFHKLDVIDTVGITVLVVSIVHAIIVCISS